MASLTVRFEMEAVTEACADINRTCVALAHRHGEVFRQLERDILAMAESINAGSVPAPDLHDLGDGIVVFAPPKPIPDLLRRARQLGVI